MTVQGITQEQPKEAEQATLSLQDLVVVMQIIQAANSRGAFQPGELSTVGGLYDKLVKFLEAAGALSKTGEPTLAADSTQAPAASTTQGETK